MTTDRTLIEESREWARHRVLTDWNDVDGFQHKSAQVIRDLTNALEKALEEIKQLKSQTGGGFLEARGLSHTIERLRSIPHVPALWMDRAEQAEARLDWFTKVLMCRLPPGIEEGQALYGRRFVEDKDA